ncbi:4Fe-4S binding protein [Ovoidimarina sediminis]|uniref:4Fe-4S binding protein n=1 Tax=Ovoidimarina sediminis TaxID=3079856 RepID=UPI0029138A37|nr:4Fe-4S binding protein [Rhodophyticola sp. MJ-SS7]MDU8942056.1 4Fe-4S binding protein [Rhodophyticola sp. MJ-SS7]
MTKLLLCDCAGTQTLDREGIAKATGLACSKIHTGLCTRELDLAAEALRGGDVIVACQQEADTFEALAEEVGANTPLTVDIRDRAGWSDEGARATPKIAALVAAAILERQPEKTIDVSSEGLCLVVGAEDVALPLAERLSETLSVTCLLPEPADILPGTQRNFDVIAGRLKSATGSFGAFKVTIDAYQGARPGGRGPLSFSEPMNGASSQCDIIVDVSGGAALFPAPEKRDGYLRADPGDPAAVARVGSEASGLVGTFEKTLHVAVEPTLCAHSRAEQTGCTRCLDLCPTGAISPAGDHVEIDPMICAGCGACSSVCPSGAVSFDAPAVADTFRALRLMAERFIAAGGTLPRLLVHDDGHGREMIALSARLGRGLPADVVPFEIASVGAFGHAEMVAALASGFGAVHVLLSPKSERDPAERELALARALLGGAGWPYEAVQLLDLNDPDALSDQLYGPRPKVPQIEPILPLGPRRDVTRLATRALAGGPEAAPFALPEGAPYGAVLVDSEACTLCLSCVGLCPSGALDDNADKPEIRFKEDACLQCGICATICPEDAITLKPQMDFSEAALTLRVLHGEEPFACIECGALFGVKSTIDKIVETLAGKHSMFTNSDNARLIQMCDDCRVKAQYHSEGSPFRMGDRPRPRTTDDYLKN